MRICTKAKEQKQFKELRGATGCRKAMRSTYKRKLEHKKQEQIKIQMYRYIKGLGTRKIRN